MVSVRGLPCGNVQVKTRRPGLEVRLEWGRCKEHEQSGAREGERLLAKRLGTVLPEAEGTESLRASS